MNEEKTTMNLSVHRGCATKSLRRPSAAFVAVLAAMALAASLPASADAAFGIKTFSGEISKANGEAETQAAAHPAEFDTTIGFNTVEEPEFGIQVPDGGIVKDIETALPPGLLGNPTAVAECSPAKLLSQAPNGQGYGNCPAASQVGVVSITEPTLVLYPIPLYNIEPRPGVPAAFGFNLIGSIVQLNAKLRSGSDYGITIDSANISQSLSTLEVTVTIWGNPSDPSHNALRLCDNGIDFGCGVAAGDAFLTNPSNCSAGPLTTNARADSWSNPGVFDIASFDEDVNGVPLAFEGCEDVPFEPQMTLQPTSTEAASPTGLDVELTMPQPQNPDGLGEAPLKRAVVTLPEGMSVNPSSVAGLTACSESQVALDSGAAASCPGASKLGTVEIATPLLREPVSGAVYLAEQGTNPFGSLIALYVVAEAPQRGVTVKLAGKVALDPQSGRLGVTFDDNPQLPFSSLKMRFSGGPRAALINPPACGSYPVIAEMSPWSAADPDNPTAAEVAGSSSAFTIDRGPGGGPCPSGAFEPKLSAGTANPVAATYSPFLLRLTRADGTQPLSAVTATLPNGLLGKLRGIPYCPDAALAGVSGAAGTGAAQLVAPACPAASQVGSVSVGAGAGPSPFYVETGRAYLAGPYKGAPLSLAFLTPALAGPFDLGSVVVRAALRVDPATARITAVSDPLPSILHGIPLNLRDVRVNLDRPGFTLNPTSCDPMAFAGHATSTQGASAPLAERFQVAGCERLAFRPKLSLRLKGATKRSGHPQLTAILTQKPGGANIARASVAMPRSEFLAQDHIRTVCTRVQFAANACPKGSVYGKARAFTPLLDRPLEGPVYLRSSSNKLPDLVADLRGQIDIELVGRIDSKNGGIRTTFDTVPDAPVTRFVLKMHGGKRSLLENSRNLCRSKNRATVKMDAQNGKARDFRPTVRAVGCKKHGRRG